MPYDYLIVGSGLFGSVFAAEACKRGKSCLVIDKRSHVGGNVYCDNIEGINVHRYGAHIFHTSDKQVWDYVSSYVTFNHFTNQPIANYRGRLFNLPFNMNTFYQMWGVQTPEQAESKINEQRSQVLAHLRAEGVSEPRNLEEQALSLVGSDIYNALIKGYTEKQWGRPCSQLPAFIIRRLPVRFTFDNNYFNDPYQGIPIGGYNVLIDSLLRNVDVRTNVDFFADRTSLSSLARKVVFSGPIDQFYDYRFGHLQYRTVSFHTETLPIHNYQGNAVVNYTDSHTPYTRIIEHKHFEFGSQPHTVISREYPAEWQTGAEPYYPINDSLNSALAEKYTALATSEPNVIFGGRLAEYKYYDMDKVIGRALLTAHNEFDN